MVWGGIKAAITGGSEEKKKIDDLSKAADAAAAAAMEPMEITEETVPQLIAHLRQMRAQWDAQGRPPAERVMMAEEAAGEAAAARRRAAMRSEYFATLRENTRRRLEQLHGRPVTEDEVTRQITVDDDAKRDELRAQWKRL